MFRPTQMLRPSREKQFQTAAAEDEVSEEKLLHDVEDLIAHEARKAGYIVRENHPREVNGDTIKEKGTEPTMEVALGFSAFR